MKAVQFAFLTLFFLISNHSAFALNSRELTNSDIIKLFHQCQDGSQLINFQLNGGTHSIGQLLEQSGGSRSIGDMAVFYSMTATAERLRSIIPHFDERSTLAADSESLRRFSYSTEEAACAHAEDAFRRGVKYLPKESAHRNKEIKKVLGIGSASALAYFAKSDLSAAEFKKGEHRAHLCYIHDDQARIFSLTFPKEFVSHFMQSKIAEGLSHSAGAELTSQQQEEITIRAAAQLRKFEEDSVTRFLLVQLATFTVPDFHDNDPLNHECGTPYLQVSAQTQPVAAFDFTKR
jgi:hypothetical protein